MKTLYIIRDELKRIFRNPRETTRVLLIAPVGAAFSHALYLLFLPALEPFESYEIMSAALGVIFCAMMTLWVIFSNELTFRIVVRFVLIAMYGAFAHRMILGASKIGGMSSYEFVFFMLMASIVAFFVATGYTVNEVKEKIHEITAEKPKASVLSIADRSTDESVG